MAFLFFFSFTKFQFMHSYIFGRHKHQHFVILFKYIHMRDNIKGHLIYLIIKWYIFSLNKSGTVVYFH